MEIKIIGTPEEISKLNHLISSQNEKNALLRNVTVKVIDKFVNDFGLSDKEIEESLESLKNTI